MRKSHNVEKCFGTRPVCGACADCTYAKACSRFFLFQHRQRIKNEKYDHITNITSGYLDTLKNERCENSNQPQSITAKISTSDYKDRQIITLYAAGFSFSEIAETLGYSGRAAVANRLRRMSKKLRN